MKKSDPIIIPKGIEYIGDWNGYKLEDYQFPHILNKVLTGCGYTEYCIRNDQPLVLTSLQFFVSLLIEEDSKIFYPFFLIILKIG